MRFAVFLLLSIPDTLSQFSPSDKDQILSAHNTPRALLARGEYIVQGKAEPSGTNINALVWSSDVEAGAQSWADRCVFEHSRTPGLGENLWTMSVRGPGAQVNATGKGVVAVEKWLSEFEKYGWNPPVFNRQAANSGIGHATQIMWASSKQLGCAAASCNSGTRVLLVCRYSPGGNMLGRNVYEQGPSCSACPSGTTCILSGSLKGLCA